ncbi:MAG: serine/threonine protein kinase [Proteobacteria bacterium]|nr:serine/threonine protein kinase [Pseudomonadota bacterium]
MSICSGHESEVGQISTFRDGAGNTRANLNAENPPMSCAAAQNSELDGFYELVSTRTTRLSNSMEDGGGGDLEPGSEIGPFRIVERIGQGGCGAVYIAESRNQDRRVAIKVLHSNLATSPKQVRRFDQEARVIRLINHPNIVQIYHAGRLMDGRPYFVMELIDGHRLADVLRARGRLTPYEALTFLAPICDALAAVHDAGIVHRDIKASNIMIGGEPERPLVKLLDFGIAKLLDSDQPGSELSTMGVVLGTPYSVAPEQILGRKIDRRTDIYALGVLLYRLITGQYPFESRDRNTIVQMHLDAPPPRPSRVAPVPTAVDAVVRRAMDKLPFHRYDDVLSFLAALRNALDWTSAEPEIRKSMIPVLAIYVEVRVAAADELSDSDFEAMVDILDISGEAFERAELDTLMETSESILGVVRLDGPSEGTRRRVIESAVRLRGHIGRRLADRDNLHVNVCVHGGCAAVHPGAHPQLSSSAGSITDVGSWAPERDIDGVCITPQALQESSIMTTAAVRYDDTRYLIIGDNREVIQHY